MNILISNDDGINAKGIQALIKRLKKDNHDVYVIAPDSNRSAVSNHLTMYKEHTLIQVDENSYSHTGYPADCVFTGLTGNLLKDIDVVISGINKGGNMGSDVIYSGTCAASRQAVLLGKPSIALSVEPLSRDFKEADYKYDALADFAARNLEKLMSLSKTEFPQVFVNVNALSLDEYKGVKLTDKINFRIYGDSVNVVNIKGNEYKTEFRCGHAEESKIDINSDLQYCRDGYITITRVFACPDCADVIEDIKFSL